MKPLFALLFLLVSATCFAQTPNSQPAAPRHFHSDTLARKTEKKVYICDSKTAKAYHSVSDCQGLNRCTYGIVAVTKEEADKEEAEGDYGRVKCQICW